MATDPNTAWHYNANAQQYHQHMSNLAFTKAEQHKMKGAFGLNPGSVFTSDD